MLRSIPSVRHLRVLSRLAVLAMASAPLGGCSLNGAFDRAAMQLAASPTGETRAFQAQMMPSLSSSREADRTGVQCRPPMTLCRATIKALEQGAFLDFRASTEGERATPRLLSPFDVVVRIEALDRGRCPGKLCAAHVALEGLLGDLLREGYHTQSVALFPGSAMMTLRTERIGPDAKVLKGSCRFNLDPGCVDFNTWLQQDQRSSDPCGFAQTRVFVAAAASPDFVAPANFAPSGAAPVAGVEALRLAAFDVARVRVYELLYVHKLCRNEMVLVRNG